MTVEDVNAAGDLLHELLEDNAEADRERIVALLPSLALQREVMGEASRESRRLTDVVKQWMQLARETELVDGEHGIVVTLGDQAKSGQADGVLDLKTMADRDPEAVLELARMGSLSADVRMVKAQQKQSVHAHDAMQKYLMPGERVETLKVRRIDA